MNLNHAPSVYESIVDSLASSETPSSKFIAVAQQALASCRTVGACNRYSHAIEAAAEAAPPPFCMKHYEEVYQQYSANPRWLAISLMANAQREGQGATDLWTLAACAELQNEQTLVKQHAIDESRHAQMYLTLLDLNFPDLVAESFREEMNVLSPGFSENQELQPFPDSDYAKNPSIDDFVQMNIAEIRTTFHHLMQRQALQNHCPAKNMFKSLKVLDSLLLDELKHVAYTACLIEEKAANIGEEALVKLYTHRLIDFNRITTEEIGDQVFQ
jgi:hypothetical protein